MSPLLILRRRHVGDGVDEEGRMIERRGRAGGRGREPRDGESRDGRHCFVEAHDNVLALREHRVVESLQDELDEVDVVNLGEGRVARKFIGVRLVVQQRYDSRVTRVDRRDNTQVGIDAQPLRVGVVRFDVVVIVHLADDGVVLSQSSAMSSTYSRMVPMNERASA